MSTVQLYWLKYLLLCKIESVLLSWARKEISGFRKELLNSGLCF